MGSCGKSLEEIIEFAGSVRGSVSSKYQKLYLLRSFFKMQKGDTFQPTTAIKSLDTTEDHPIKIEMLNYTFYDVYEATKLTLDAFLRLPNFVSDEVIKTQDKIFKLREARKQEQEQAQEEQDGTDQQ